MKKFLLSLVAFIATSTLTFAQDVKNILGSYNCDLFLSVAAPIDGETVPENNKPVQLLPAEKESCVNFLIENLELSIGNFGDILLENVKVAYNEATNTYSFIESPTKRLELLGGAIIANVKVNTTTSYVKDGQLYADVDIAWIQEGADDTPIYVRVISNKFTSGINTATVAKAAAKQGIYTLSGVRVANAQKGLYIVNGKKVIK